MSTIPAPTRTVAREEWPDADFDLPDDEPLHAHCTKDDDNDDDWDMEMDLGKTGGAMAKILIAQSSTRPESSRKPTPPLLTIRPPIVQSEDEDDEDEEGLSTIKAAAFPQNIFKSAAPTPPADDDIEAAFALPSNLSCLSLAPLSINSRSSKNSLEWGDKDNTSSSHSSDSYSSLGFADASPSSNSASSLSLSNSEIDDNCDEEDEGELDGLVIPSGLFESGHSGKHFTKLLEKKKRAQLEDHPIKVTVSDPEDNFEIGLVIDDDVDLSPSRLLNAQQQQHQQPTKRGTLSRSYSMPPRPPTLRPPSRLKNDRAKSPNPPPASSARHLNKLRLSPSPPLGTVTQSQPFQLVPPLPSTSPVSFLTPKPAANLRTQKSHTGLKPPSPPGTTRKFTRKGSLSSLIDATQAQASGYGSASASSSKVSRYETPTAASKAKSHKKSSTSLAQDFINSPMPRPPTPSSRLTMPTLSRTKSRPGLNNIFSSAPIPSPSVPRLPPPRPPSSASLRARITPPLNSQVAPPKILRKPKRSRAYGDGTELDAIADLPTDREKEGRFRVQPKGYGNRIPGGSYSSKTVERGLLRKMKRSVSGDATVTALPPVAPTTKTMDVLPKPGVPEATLKRKKNFPSQCQTQTKRKPTLIRNLGGAGAPKVVGDMKWNPSTLRWEGNDQILRDFDIAVGTSTRPALITHLTGSSIGSPVGSFASGARVVGNMIFDPTRMCWVSTLPPEEDEPDVFANLADDEDDADSWEAKGDTIRAHQPTTTPSSSDTSGSSISSTMVEVQSECHSRSLSDSSSERGSRASLTCDVDEGFLKSCRIAEERHRTEMRGWRNRRTDNFAQTDRSFLYEIRALATRQY